MEEKSFIHFNPPSSPQYYGTEYAVFGCIFLSVNQKRKENYRSYTGPWHNM